MIASLRLLRNCLSVENLGMRFIHSKIRYVKELSSTANNTDPVATSRTSDDEGPTGDDCNEEVNNTDQAAIRKPY